MYTKEEKSVGRLCKPHYYVAEFIQSYSCEHCQSSHIFARLDNLWGPHKCRYSTAHPQVYTCTTMTLSDAHGSGLTNSARWA